MTDKRFIPKPGKHNASGSLFLYPGFSSWSELAESRGTHKFFPCYQPIVGLTSGAIEGYEALARFRDARGQIRSAGNLFLSEDIETDFKLALDRCVRQQALKEFARNEQAGYLSINISPRWVDMLDNFSVLPSIRMVEESGIDPARIVIEITESRGDLKRLKKAVKLYHDAGMRVAIDDFGAGASQIDRIEALGPDIVKLDMRLFKQAAMGGISGDIALAITSIASRVGCHVICEGVETEEEFHFGIECGASFVQGFIFAEAQPQPLAAASTVPRVRQLRTSYLALKARKLQQAACEKERLRSIVMDIRAHHLQGGTRPEAGQMQTAGILRYYICDTSGYQLSANHEVSEQQVCQNWQCQGLNWAHRPYFPLFIGLRYASASNFLASEAYRDATSHHLCKTYATYLDDQRLLLVDARVADEVLYAAQSPSSAHAY